MGLEDVDGYMALPGELTSPSTTDDHGLRFINDDWNGSIANGSPFTLRWNESIEDEGDLRLFKITYPEEGAVSFELVSNLTAFMRRRSCSWLPEGLEEDDLYAFWVTQVNDDGVHWAVSPPWTPQIKGEEEGLRWNNTIGIPIVVIMGIYFMCLAFCLAFRKRRRRRQDREKRRRHRTTVVNVPPDENTDRQHSVSSVVTVQSLTEEDSLMKRDPGHVEPVSPAPSLRPEGVRWNILDWGSDNENEHVYGGRRAERQRSWEHEDHWEEGPIGQAH